jgi:hypothetical protein
VSDEQQKAERDALLELMQSDGWRVFREAAEAAYGDAASLRRIDATLAVLDPGAMESEREAFRSIRAESNAVLALLQWPTQRIAELQTEKRTGFLGRRRVG